MRERIGLDLLCLAGERTGMAWQAWWLAKLLPDVAPDLEYVHFLPPGVAGPVDDGRVTIVRVPSPSGRGGRLLGEQWHLPRAAARARLDLLHTIAYGPPVLYRGRKLLTVHDLGFLVLPDSLPARWRAYWNWAYGRAADGCAGYVAVSESTRRDMAERLRRDPARIHVVPPGVDDSFFAAADPADDRRQLDSLGIPTQFLLHVGTLQPRKDIHTLLGTFARLAPEHADLHLVMVGGQGWGYPHLDEHIASTGLGDRIHRPGYIPAQVRPALYRSARALAFTSRYEGFGLPLVEAMAAGLPVVATDVSSIPEVTGDAALLAPPGDADALAAHLSRVLTEPALRANLIARGRDRARRFNWLDAARRTADVHRALVRENDKGAG